LNLPTPFRDLMNTTRLICKGRAHNPIAITPLQRDTMSNESAAMQWFISVRGLAALSLHAGSSSSCISFWSIASIHARAAKVRRLLPQGVRKPRNAKHCSRAAPANMVMTAVTLVPTAGWRRPQARNPKQCRYGQRENCRVRSGPASFLTYSAANTHRQCHQKINPYVRLGKVRFWSRHSPRSWRPGAAGQPRSRWLASKTHCVQPRKTMVGRTGFGPSMHLSGATD